MIINGRMSQGVPFSLPNPVLHQPGLTHNSIFEKSFVPGGGGGMLWNAGDPWDFLRGREIDQK